IDFHTHLFTPCHGSDICWWGIEELLNYHYLIAETLRYCEVTPEKYYSMGKKEQSNLIWKTLFVDRTPISEGTRGVITCLSKLGVDPNERDLDKIRKYYSQYTFETFVDKVFSVGNIKHIYMTNDPLEPAERKIWLKGHGEEPRFKKALRIDGFVKNSDFSKEVLSSEGFPFEDSLNSKSIANIRKFFEKWCDIIQPDYMAASMTPDFIYPSDTMLAKLVKEVVIPIAKERNYPVALMIGVRRLVNPALKMAGDSLGLSDVPSVEALCRENPDVRFLVTMLARENQHAMAVASRKFPNLTVFGCWWFLNNPSLIEEITRMRMEILGMSFIPQHSDCRVIDQLIYKWDHSRKIIAKVMVDKYADLAAVGYNVTDEQVKKDAYAYLCGNIENSLAR
ncbi:MAG: glucuronate isomerase, partial [Fibrobacteres bacterium]|nr:glucuronate isomerase [Fibrobacterota bacterium]